MFSRTGVPVVLGEISERGETDLASRVGGQGALFTAQTSRHRDLAELLESSSADADVAAMARNIAQRLAIRPKPCRSRRQYGAGPAVPAPYSYRSDDIDLDRTIENLLEHRQMSEKDIVVRERMRSRRAAVLIVDVSGSMRGEKIKIAAATVAALSREFSQPSDQFAVVAFWSDAAVLSTFVEPTNLAGLIDDLARIPAKGLTNVGFGLSVAYQQLAASAAPRRHAILLSDSVHNAGPDPRPLARQLPALDVLLEVDGEHDVALGRDLARAGRGRMATVATHHDVAPSLNRLLARR